MIAALGVAIATSIWWFPSSRVKSAAALMRNDGRLKADYEQLVEALRGGLNENQRWLLKRLLGQVETLEKEISIHSERIKEQMLPNSRLLERLDTIGGVGQRSA